MSMVWSEPFLAAMERYNSEFLTNLALKIYKQYILIMEKENNGWAKNTKMTLLIILFSP